ncbi:MAG: CotH kinase family protein [Gemmataceae bacterium]
MKRCLFIAVLLIEAAVLVPGRAEPPAKPDPSDDFFNNNKVWELSIEIDKPNLELLRRENRKYVRCTLTEGGKVYKDVGVHLKGAAGSFRNIDDKPGLTLNMDKFMDGQTFHGLDKFHLANSVQDRSFLSELICGELMRDAGVPASRISFAIVTINGRKRGLYYLKEGYDKSFIQRHFQTKKGNFYDGGFLRDIDQPLQVISNKDDVAAHADLKALLAACREQDKNKRFQTMEQLLDMDRFLSYLALEVLLWDWDGYPLNRNNYRIYHDPQRNKLVFIPSGMDQMFGNPGSGLFANFNGLVARSLLETPEGKKRYLARAEEIMKNSFKAEARVKRLDELQTRVLPALKSVDPGHANGYPNDVKRLKDAILHRAKSFDEQLKQAKK